MRRSVSLPHRHLLDDMTSLMVMLPTLIAVVAIAVITAGLIWRFSRRARVPRTGVKGREWTHNVPGLPSR